MTWLAILNVIAGIGLYLSGIASTYVYRVQHYATYREFVRIGAVDEEKLRTLAPPGSPPGTGYDLQRKMRSVGNAEDTIQQISWLGAGACILNAGVILILHRKDGRSVA